ncbi:hypothetical protein O7599_18250 [Streptomyces sp. WMMC500]|uniref:hypothetical protein n=1 Tax=Streptomyces sp. WMMC500 TaxID=3015154 RepID=UPI00248CBAFE|nr:hypothetical protein [Streptomyces sp. WMMC500]WBB64330.1 hypothetical protein O7599_18250 [Streptomyces sp. WMMC500]
MTYVVTVDAQIAQGAPEMDELQRVGAIALLEQGFEAVEGIDGPDGVEVEVLDTVVAVYPGGALLKVFVDAPALEFAEDAMRSLVGELLGRTELLAEWTVEQCEVQLHPDLAKESLDAAEGPDVPPADLEERRAHLARRPESSAPSEEKLAADAERARRQMLDLAGQLRAFGPEMFGVVSEDDEDVEEDCGYEGTAEEDARLAAGSLVWATDVMVDQLFMDVQTLAEADTDVAECEGVLWHLEELPGRYALRYDARFARRFLVTVIAMTTRFTQGTFTQLSCVAEELALRLLLAQAKASLETFDLLDDGVSSALDCFADLVYEDMDHELLYDDAMDGIDDSPVGDVLGVATMQLGDWFKPFNDGRYVHPYAADESPEPPDEPGDADVVNEQD